MLSDKEFARELGKGIKINPFKAENVEGADIYLTASRLAWSLRTGDSLYKNGKIIIPSNDTALIVTNEFVRLDNKHAATCYARLSLTMRGLGYFSTPIKPNFGDRLIIALQSNKNNDIPIDVDEKIVAVMFFKLTSSASITKSRNSSVDGRLSQSGAKQMTIEEQGIYKLHSEDNDKENNEHIKLFKKSKSKINVMLFITVILFMLIGIGILSIFLPPNYYYIKQIAEKTALLAVSGAFISLYKLIGK